MTRVFQRWDVCWWDVPMFTLNKINGSSYSAGLRLHSDAWSLFFFIKTDLNFELAKDVDCLFGFNLNMLVEPFRCVKRFCFFSLRLSYWWGKLLKKKLALVIIRSSGARFGGSGAILFTSLWSIFTGDQCHLKENVFLQERHTEKNPVLWCIVYCLNRGAERNFCKQKLSFQMKLLAQVFDCMLL